MNILGRLLAGVALGVFFYGALWFTVKALPGARHPVLLALGSFWARIVTVLAGVFLMMNGRWEYAAVCMAGFMMGRLAVARIVGHSPVEQRGTGCV